MRLLRRPIARLGGDAYLLGDTILLIWGGGLDRHWSQGLAGAGFLFDAAILSVAGDKAGWFAFSCLLAIPLIGLSAWDDLYAGLPMGWAGFLISVAGFLMGAVSLPLARHYRHAASLLARLVLGKPRKTMGLLIVAGKFPLLYSAAINVHWLMVLVFSLWIVGDSCVGLSPVSDQG